MTEKNGRHPVEVVAEVKSMELDLDHNGSYKLQLEDGTTIIADFTSSQWGSLEGMHNRGRYSIKIVGEGDYADGRLQRIVSIDLKKSEQVRPPGDPNELSIWERLAAIADSIPEEELAKIPPDFSANYKRYMYGWPKREEKAAE